MKSFLYLLGILGALAGVFEGVSGFLDANGAPQQAAGAAFGCLLAIGPYVLARSFDEMTRPIPKIAAPPAVTEIQS